jgi:hypothetical protein
MCSEVQKQIQLETEITLSFFCFFVCVCVCVWVRTRKQGTRNLETNQVRNPDPKVYQINSWGRNGRVFTRAIESFGQILGKLTFKCRQLQVPILPAPILCRFVHLMFVRVSTQRKPRTTQVGPQARGSHVLWQGRAAGTQKGAPQTHLSRLQTSVSASVWTLNTLRFLLPTCEIRVKEPPLPGI